MYCIVYCKQDKLKIDYFIGGNIKISANFALLSSKNTLKYIFANIT